MFVNMISACLEDREESHLCVRYTAMDLIGWRVANSPASWRYVVGNVAFKDSKDCQWIEVHATQACQSLEPTEEGENHF